MKKLISLVLALALVFAVAVASAATITVQNIVNGQTYTAYKLLNYTNSDTAFAYYLTDAQYKDGENLTSLATVLTAGGLTFAQGTDTNWYVSNTGSSSISAASLTTALKNAISNDTFATTDALATETVVAANDAADFGNLATGYWFVSSTTGALVSLNSIDAKEMVFDKNEKPDIDKSITGIAGDDDHVASNGNSGDAKVGDTINYQVVITAKKGAQNYIFHDKMEAGLTYVPGTFAIAGMTAGNQYTVVYNSATPAVASDVTGNADIELGDNITIRFNKTYLDTITADTNITITYNAVINENAIIDSEGNDNTVKLEYGHQPGDENGTVPGPDSREETVTVYTYAIAIKKVNTAGEPLEGVSFRFPFKVKTVANKDYVMYDSTSTASDTTILQTDADGKITVVGVDAGTYSITETATLQGYNVLTGAQQVTAQLIGATTTTKHFYIDENGNETLDDTKTEVTYQNDDVAATVIMVINKTGVELPSTGGIGTTIFYIVGGMLLVGAAIVLVARRKASN